MLDFDLSELYEVETRSLNQAVKRNIRRFPSDFMFQLTNNEFENLISQSVTSRWGGLRKLPYAFTEHGVSMAKGLPRPSLNEKMVVQVVGIYKPTSCIIS